MSETRPGGEFQKSKNESGVTQKADDTDIEGHMQSKGKQTSGVHQPGSQTSGVHQPGNQKWGATEGEDTEGHMQTSKGNHTSGVHQPGNQKWGAADDDDTEGHMQTSKGMHENR